ncbi:MAG: erythromycin esterase family protein [Parvibaculaceae bacterium]
MNAIQDWIRGHAIQLTTVEAGNGFADLEPLGRVIGDARIVSLGEATHGTREFFQLKHRLLEYCVSELGFTVFGIEASYPECLRINDYVLDGRGDPAGALAGQRFWTWDTEEVLALVEWLRGWNLTHDRKVKFYGFDMQSPGGAAAAALDYLRRVAPGMVVESERDLWPLLTDLTTDRFRFLPEATRERALSRARQILEAFDQEKEGWAARTGAHAWQLARLNAVVLNQFRPETNRDIAMAENVAALLDIEGPGAKAVLWAHNGHVARESDYVEADKTPIPNMGTRLHELFGTRHLVVGFAFNEGSFQAVEFSKGLIDHTVGPAAEGSLDHGLASADIPIFLLDLATAPASGPVNDWLASRPKSRWIGAVYAEDRAADLMVSNDPRRAYDILAFVDKTNAARGMPTGKRPFHAERKLLNPQPVNLGLESSGLIPAGWHRPGAGRPHEHRIEVVTDGAEPRALQIARKGAPWLWGDGRLEQTFAAAPWHGKRLCFSAFVRAETKGPQSGAQLYIELRPEVAEEMIWRIPPAEAAMLDGLVRDPDWRRYAIAIDVTEATHSITVGMAFSGDGSGWFRELKLESG